MDTGKFGGTFEQFKFMNIGKMRTKFMNNDSLFLEILITVANQSLAAGSYATKNINPLQLTTNSLLHYTTLHYSVPEKCIQMN